MVESDEKSSYGKRPLWQWIAIYAVIGAIIYGVIYYFVFAHKSGGYSSNSNNSSLQQQNTQQKNPNGY